MSKKKKKYRNADFWRYCNEKSLDNDRHNSTVGREIPDPQKEYDEEIGFDDFMSNAKTKTFSSYFGDDDLSDTFGFLNNDKGSTETGIENDDEDEIFENLRSSHSKTFKDYFEEDYSFETKEELQNELSTSEILSLSSVSDSRSSLRDSLGVDKPSVKPPLLQTKKDNAKRLTLEEMQRAIVSKVTLITHNGGLYYYNSRTYKAICNSYELLSLIRSRISSSAFSSASTKQFFDLLVYLKADDSLVPANYEERLNQSKYFVVLRNGVLDLRTLTLLPHSPRYLTFHEFDAEYVDKKPKVFLRFLEDVSGGDPEIICRIVEVMGYLFSGINRRYFFVAGTAPCSGKSTLGLLLQALVGEEQVSSISTHQLDSRFSLGGTRNKILNLAMDVPKGHLSSVTVSLLKSISGGDPIIIEEKYQPAERIVSRLRFLFGTNYKICVPQSEDEDAFWSRMIVLPFCYSVPQHKIDYMLLDKLVEEKDRIISYCLRAMSKVLDNNCRFSECQAADEMKADWRSSGVDLKSFESYWYETVDVTGDPDDEVFSMELYQRYQDYCNDRHLEIVPYNYIKRWITTNARGVCTHKRIHRTNENPRSGYTGIRFINRN